MKHPYQILTSDKEGKHLFAVVKNYLQVFNISNGEKIGEWKDTTETNYQNVQIEKRTGRQIITQQIFNHIKYLKLSKDETHIIASTDSDKSILIFRINYESTNCLELIKRQPIPKRPYSLDEDNEGNVVVGDKFGDVYVVSIDSNKPIEEKELVPILGHVSMLTDVLIGKFNNKEFIISTDRDEHIRISNYPKSYVIKDFLFGHDEFISQLYIPEYNSEILISGGGDDYLNVWKWYNGELITNIQLRNLIQDYLIKDLHLPPTRFRHDDSSKEISISRITTLKNNNDHLLLILVENTPCILVFDILDDFTKFEYKQTILTNGSIVDFTLANETIITSIESENESLEFFNLKNGKFEQIDSLKISDSIPFEIKDESEYQHLYKYYQLRKRSDCPEAPSK